MRVYRTIVPLFVFLALMLWGAIAFAADDEPSNGTAVAELAVLFLQVVIFPVLGSLLTYLAGMAAAYLKKKWDIELLDRQEAKIDEWIAQAVHWAEEKSRNRVRSGLGRIKGPDKLEEVMHQVVNQVRAKRWDDWAESSIRTKIEGYLGKKRANGGKPTLDKGPRVGPMPLPGPGAA